MAWSERHKIRKTVVQKTISSFHQDAKFFAKSLAQRFRQRVVRPTTADYREAVRTIWLIDILPYKWYRIGCMFFYYSTLTALIILIKALYCCLKNKIKTDALLILLSHSWSLGWWLFRCTQSPRRRQSLVMSVKATSARAACRWPPFLRSTFEPYWPSTYRC